MTKQPSIASGKPSQKLKPAFMTIATVYAPMPKNAAWPSDFWPA